MMIERRKTDGKVISLAQYRAKAVPGLLRQVEGYWEGLRDGRLVPSRSQVDPRGLGDALAHTFLLERIAPGLARIRVAGRHLSDLMGMEVQGMPFSTLFLPEARDALADALSAVFEEPAVVHVSLESPAAFRRHALPAQLVLLPMKNDFGDVTRVLGCLVTDGILGRTPRRFRITSQHRRTLVGYAEPRTAVTMPAMDPSPPSEPQRTPAPILELVPRD